jgi:hypothetical protein
VALRTVIPVLGLRHGFVSAVLALWIALATPILTDFYWTGGPYLGAAIFGTALMLAPAIWATRIWARRPRTPSVATAFPG